MADPREAAGPHARETPHIASNHPQRHEETTMTSTVESPATDLAAVKQRQQQAWASGDYSAMAARIVLVAEHLCDTADLRAGWHVLDVATGSGNAAIAAARHGCEVVGIDYVPSLLERGRARAEAEGLDVALLEGDAESLPFADRTFDAVVSVFGSMFTPDHERTAAEMVRVARSGATIALASWTPEGFIGQLFRTVAAHVPPPAGVPSPMLWGTEAHLRELFGEGIVSLEVAERDFTFRFRSPEDLVGFFRTRYGPTVKAFAALADDDARAVLERDLVELVRRFDRLDGDAVAIPATYTEAIAITR
jgi:SAM-dependent methyltransferase